MAKNYRSNITGVLCDISNSEGVALSTLKSNARILRGLELIEFGEIATITNFGSLVLSILENGDDHG